jgi:histidinol-phosphatase (PHP family)
VQGVNHLIRRRIKMLNLPDLHIHTLYCGHAEGSMEDSVRSAINKNLSYIGFTGHFPYPSDFIEPVPDCAIPQNRFSEFVSEVHRLQNVYSNQIKINLAAEIDYLNKNMLEEQKTRIKEYPFDYILGSIHLVDRIPIDYSEEVLLKSIDQLGGVDGMWNKYLKSMETMIQSDIFDVVAHMDLPKKLKISQPQKDYSEQFVSLLHLMRERNLVLEVNTGGIDRSYKHDCYPSKEILSKAWEMGIDIMLGSDAHSPQQVGRYFDEAVSLIKSIGWNKIIVFEKREKKYIELQD